MSNNFKLGSADWNLWPMSMEYEEIFPVFKKSGIQNLELGIYHPSKELTLDNCARITRAASANGIAITAALFSLTPDRWPDGAFSNKESDFLRECSIFFRSLDQLGIKYANIWTGADLPDSDTEEVGNTLRELNSLAESFSGVVSIEYKAETIFPNGKSLAVQLSAFAHLKVLIDTGHAFALEENVVELIKDLNSRKLMGAMHLGDAIAGDSDADLPCGRVHDFSEIIKTLTEINYSGSANFDLYGAAIDENGPGPLNILDESLQHINRIMGVGV